MTRLIAYHEATALAGLGWEVSPDRLSDRRFGVRWGDTFAELTEAEHRNQPALLSLIAGGLEKSMLERALIVAHADPDQGVFFGAALLQGNPALEEEHLFDTEDQLIDWVARELGQGDFDMVAATAHISQSLPEELTRVAIGAPDATYEYARATGIPPRNNPIKLARKYPLATAALVACIAGGLFVGPAALERFMPQTTQAEVRPTQTIYVGRDEVAFLEACAGAFDEAWLISPGWVRDLAGCTAPGMAAPADVAVMEPLAFQIYRLEAGWDPTISRATARLVLEATNETFTGTDRQLVVTRALKRPKPSGANQASEHGRVAGFVPTHMFEMALEAQVPIPSEAAQREQFDQAFVGRARGTESAGRNINSGLPEYKVQLWGAPRDATEVIASLPWAQLSRLEERDQLVSAWITPRVLHPLTMTLSDQGDAQ